MQHNFATAAHQKQRENMPCMKKVYNPIPDFYIPEKAMLFSGKGSCANRRANSPKTTKHEAIYLCSRPRKYYRKHLTKIATSLHPVSLNIVLRTCPGLISGKPRSQRIRCSFIFFQISSRMRGFLQYTQCCAFVHSINMCQS